MSDANFAQPRTADSHLARYRSALKKYDVATLEAVALSLGIEDVGRQSKLGDRIFEALGESKLVEGRYASLPQAAKTALTLFALPEIAEWPGDGLQRALRLAGVDPREALEPLAELGFLVFETQSAVPFVTGGRLLAVESHPFQALVHPLLLGLARTELPPGGPPPIEGAVGQIRQSDGLEPLLRLGAVWQRLEEAPLRRTQLGAFFKRDRERLEDDPAIVGPISDAVEPLPDQALFWVALAEAVGLAVPEAGEERIVAAKSEYWADNAVHLPQMLAVRWLGLKTWHELGGSRLESAGPELTTVSLRLPLLLLLAKAEGEGWAAVDDLVEGTTRARPNWGFDLWPIKPKGDEPSAERRLVESVLLGAAYQLGLLQVGEEILSGRRVVRLSDQGRYALSIGPPPRSGPHFEHFLFVQPNFEIIAYRQGLTPSLIGKFSRFARWSKLGAAIELKLTSDSVYRGLEGGMRLETMRDLLAKHSSRPLPAGIGEALRTWSGRRERVTFHAAATLVEFATDEDLDAAIKDWPTEKDLPVRVSPRLLLVDEVASIPFQRFKQAGARDYRKPAEPCVEVGADGVTLAIDLGRSDLLVDAELARFSDEKPPLRDGQVARRRFVVGRESLARGVEAGLTAAQLSRWFLERAGVAMPASIRLMMHAATPSGSPISIDRPRVLAAPSEELLDGLLQHPATRDAFIERIGPRHAVVMEEHWPKLRTALTEMGLPLVDP